ncbi:MULTISPECIES: NAD(P)-dependent oxidoreductase [unclassified Bacillus (in: firmicutes)]|uniref:NAD-dependent epimerase/dehydratase family protein n=1 Tax=unclassified Bacillus (in: firmicutes) TaxID=185979 RepID=UPI001BE80E6E|nr:MULTISPECIES: NAD(P)-dependent oxidoreductase [unclassified Bacillus (in: firmicutes)]MBT2616772.1 NAD(P)-dependent oxidoreductase [Bacillus sp. ISL-78]MBT2631490.1 NAD(P)-dependent oxidoreductase [Bacillus sp. ISL-101]
MRIAITGGTGFLGKYVVEYLKKENYTPIILTRKKKEIPNINCECRITDYSEKDLIDKLLDIDAVVHLAAKRGSQGRIVEFHDNEMLTQNLYEACCGINITNIVYASTISVYSDETLLPWTEIQLPKPALMYGVSKLTNENIGNIFSNKKGLNIKNLRLAHLYGFNEKNNYMINRFFRQAFHHEQLVLNAKSVAKREFLYGKDAAKAIFCSLKQSSISGTFNVGSGDALTNFEVADTINDQFGNRGNLLVMDNKANEGIDSSFMDSSKAKTKLDFSPDYTFSAAINEIYTMMKGLDDVPLLY